MRDINENKKLVFALRKETETEKVFGRLAAADEECSQQAC